MGKLMTKAEFARTIGKTRQYIQKLDNLGKLVMAGKKVDYEASLISLESVATVQSDLRDQFNDEQKGNGPKKAAENRGAGISAQTGKVEDIDPNVKNTSIAMQKARLLAELNSAKIKEVEYRKIIGELIPKEIVYQENAKIAEVVRSKLLSIPQRAAPRIINMNKIPEVVDHLTLIINEILNEFQELAKTAKVNYDIK